MKLHPLLEEIYDRESAVFFIVCLFFFRGVREKELICLWNVFFLLFTYGSL